MLYSVYNRTALTSFFSFHGRRHRFSALVLAFVMCLASFGTAHAAVTTVTYTIDREIVNNGSAFTFYLKGSDGTRELIYDGGAGAHPQEVTIEMGDDVTFKAAAGMITSSYSDYSEEVSGFRYFFNFNGGTSGSYNFTFTSKSRYVSHVEIIGYGYEYAQRVKTTMETHNEAKTCTMQWVSEVGTTHKGYPEMFIVTYSDSPAYTITYNLNGGTNSVSNPYGYKPGTAVTLADPTRTFYEFGGWYDSENLRDSPITGSSLPNTKISVGKKHSIQSPHPLQKSQQGKQEKKHSMQDGHLTSLQ